MTSPGWEQIIFMFPFLHVLSAILCEREGIQLYYFRKIDISQWVGLLTSFGMLH